MREIIVVAHDIRSCHNVGSLLRTAEGIGVTEVVLTGYTPYPRHAADERLPHIAAKITRDIHKTALGAEDMIAWRTDDIRNALLSLRTKGFTLIALEQTDNSTPLPSFSPPQKVAILLGREVEGIDPELLAMCDIAVEIPMHGKKESFNVVQAAAMVLYHCRFIP